MGRMIETLLMATAAVLMVMLVMALGGELHPAAAQSPVSAEEVTAGAESMDMLRTGVWNAPLLGDALVLQRQFKEGCAGMRAKLLGVWHGSAWPAHYYPASPSATAAVQPARTVPGAAIPAPPGRPPFTRGQALRPRDPGHLFPPKPVAGSAEKLRPAGTGPRGDANPPRACPVLDTGCGSRTHPGPRRSSPSQTPFLYATGSLPRMPGSPGECPRERWTGSSGVHCRPGSGGKWPSGFRRASACLLAAPSER